MLSEELLIINKIIQDDIAVIDAIDWFVKLDKAKQRHVVSQVSKCLERANPGQEGVDAVIDRWRLAIGTHLADIFSESPYEKAIIKANEVPDNQLGNSFVTLIELFRYFDELQRKTICKNGCDHEWHNLTWTIRTDDVQELVDFYSLLGLKPEYHKHGSGFHYSIQNGQSILNIYRFPKTKKDRGLGLHIKFTLENYDEVIRTLKKKQVPFLDKPETGNMAVVADPDGRKIELHRS